MDGDLEAGPYSRYILLEELGRDALGRVYRALTTQGGEAVVLRVLHVAACVPAERVELAREHLRTRLLQSKNVRHAGLARVLDVGSVGTVDWVATELVGGHSLSAILDAGQPFTFVRAIRIAINIAEAMSAAHAAGCVHGRLSLTNVHVSGRGVRVLDLGTPRAEEFERHLLDRAMPLRLEQLRASDVNALCDIARTVLAAARADDAEAMLRGQALRAAVDAGLHRAGGLADARAVRDVLIAGVRQVYSSATEPADGGSAVPSPPQAAPAPEPVFLSVDGIGEEIEFSPPALQRDHPKRYVSRVAASIAFLATAAVAVIGATREERREESLARYSWYRPEALEAAPVRGSPAAFVTTESPESLRTVAAPDGVTVSQRSAAPAERTAGRTATSVADVPEAKPARPPGTPRLRLPATVVATVRVQPPGATIHRGDDFSLIGADSLEVSVGRTDSLVLLFRKAGHVPERRTFRGEPLNVRLSPDSVSVSFFSNVRAEVFLETGNGGRLLGRTDLRVQLPTGRHRFRFRTPHLPDWTVDQEFTVAGERYQVAKLDFPTRGRLVVNVASACATVSLDGGPARPAPATFDDVPPARHIVRVVYGDGFALTDTLNIVPGRTTSRVYDRRDVAGVCERRSGS